ncbi:MAG: hypothetical protein H6816_14205 [Phycisphaerales bacterium]|nr:hypothetical protein [Phycisphaerales bacterium]
MRRALLMLPTCTNARANAADRAPSPHGEGTAIPATRCSKPSITDLADAVSFVTVDERVPRLRRNGVDLQLDPAYSAWASRQTAQQHDRVVFVRFSPMNAYTAEQTSLYHHAAPDGAVESGVQITAAARRRRREQTVPAIDVAVANGSTPFT